MLGTLPKADTEHGGMHQGAEEINDRCPRLGERGQGMGVGPVPLAGVVVLTAALGPRWAGAGNHVDQGSPDPGRRRPRLWSLSALGGSLRPYPKPRRASELVEHGPLPHRSPPDLLVHAGWRCWESAWSDRAGTAAPGRSPCLVAGQAHVEEAWLREHYPATTSTAKGCATGSSPAFCDQFPTRSNRMIVLA